MGLVSQQRWKESVPAEDAWIEFQPLPGPALQAARDVRAKKAMALSSGVTLSASQLDSIREAVQTGAQQQDPKDEYDAETLLVSSIVSWSYEVPVNIADLDSKTWSWAIDIILDRNGMRETETERKNGLKRHTSPLKG